jgi:hypothetical protein
MVRKIKFPHPEEILAKIEFDWFVLNISEQLVKKAEFVKRVEELLGMPIAQIVNIETVVGLKEGEPSRSNGK